MCEGIEAMRRMVAAADKVDAEHVGTGPKFFWGDIKDVAAILTLLDATPKPELPAVTPEHIPELLSR